jgi:GDP-L-fucose synthase
MKKVFITGGNGFLGGFLIKELEKLNYQITAPSSKECNLLNEDSLMQYNAVNYDIIFHLAAWTQAGDFCIYHPGEQWINNQKINTNTIDWWFTYQKSAKFVFMGTSCSYSPENELVESNYMKGEPIDSLYTYAMTKRMLYQGAAALSRQFDMDWLCFVPSTLYGPNYHNDGRQMHFIFDLIRKIIRGKEYGEDVVLWGDGTQKREIIHVRNFVDSMISISESNVKNEIINIGYGSEFEIRRFAEVICKEVNYNFEKIKFDLDKYVGAKSKCLSIAKMQLMNPKFEETLIPIEVGIKEVIDWFYENKCY